MSADDMADAVEVLVDAESGILLRIPELDENGQSEVLELVRADFAPVIDSSLFKPPPGSRIAESFGDAFSGPLRPAWLAATTVGGLAAGALGAWIKYSPFRHTATSGPGGIDAEEIPRDEPPPDRTLTGPPVSDDVLDLLRAGGPTELEAALHEWLDIGANRVAPGARSPSPLRRARDLPDQSPLPGPSSPHNDRLRRATPLAGLRRQDHNRTCPAITRRYW